MESGRIRGEFCARLGSPQEEERTRKAATAAPAPIAKTEAMMMCDEAELVGPGRKSRWYEVCARNTVLWCLFFLVP